MSQKRNRSINWDEEEKLLFRSILKGYANIIENKSLDTNVNRTKTKTWEQINKKFNELNSRPRDLNQLKIQWKTMKINARKIISTFKKEVSKSGGGPRPATPNNAVIDIKDILNPAEHLRDHNIHANIINAKIPQENVELDTVEANAHEILLKDNTTNKIPAKKEHESYVSSMLIHTKLLKNKEHKRHMEMAEEKHKIEMEIQTEKLKCAILEREILEIRKARESNI